MKVKITLIATVVASLGIFAAPAAQATCTEVIDGVCTEQAVCNAPVLREFDCVE